MATIYTRAAKGSALTWTEGDANITNLNNAKIENVVEDTSPQLGGNLDVNGNSIVSTSNSNIAITPNGTGSVVLDGLNWPQADGSNGQVLTTNGSGQLSFSTVSGGAATLNDLTDVTISSPGADQILKYDTLTNQWINAAPSTPSIALDGLSDVTTTTPSNGQALVYNGSTFQWENQTISSGGISDVVADTTPQLGGDLDVNGKKIVSVSNGNIAIEPNGTGIVTANKNIETTGDVKAKELWATNSTGDEGGQINLAQPATNSTLDGDTVTVDIYQNKFRIFEQGGSARGVYIDLTAAATGVGTNLLSGSGATTLDGLNDVVITSAATGDILRYNGTNWVDTAESSITVGTASVASTVTLTADNTTNATNYPLFVDAATGNLSPRTDTGFTYNPSTGTLTATTFSGTLSGNASNVSGTVALANGGTGQTSAPAAMAALIGFTTTATAGGTTTLTNTSTHYQVFTGTNTQNIQLPSTATLSTGWTFHICHNGTVNSITVVTSASNSVIVIPPGSTAMVTCISTAGNTAAAWEAGLTDFSTYTGTGSVVLGTSPSISGLTLTGTLNAGGGVGSSGQVLQSTGTGVQWATASGGGNNMILLSVASGGSGTITFPSTINTNMNESWTLDSTGGVSGVSVSTNTFTLPAGTYAIKFPISVATNNVPASFYLRNITDSTTVFTVSGDTISWGGQQRVFFGQPNRTFTIAASKTFSLRSAFATWTLQAGWTSENGFSIMIIKTA